MAPAICYENTMNMRWTTRHMSRMCYDTPGICYEYAMKKHRAICYEYAMNTL